MMPEIYLLIYAYMLVLYIFVFSITRGIAMLLAAGYGYNGMKFPKFKSCAAYV